MTKQSVSIITVHYNDIGGLKRTAESVEALGKCSSGVDIEWILIDGGSDFSRHLELKKNLEFMAEIFISEPDNGIYHAMNKGISYAKYDWVIFMNAGDTFFSSNVLDEVFDENRNIESTDIIYGAAFEGKTSHTSDFKLPRSPKALWWGMPTHHQAILFKLRSLKKFCYDETMSIAADYKLVCLMSKDFNRVSLFLKPVCFFDTTGVSSNHFFKGLKEQQQIRSSVLKINCIKNIAILFAKLLARWGRNLMPKFYKLIRYDK